MTQVKCCVKPYIQVLMQQLCRINTFETMLSLSKAPGDALFSQTYVSKTTENLVNTDLFSKTDG